MKQITTILSCMLFVVAGAMSIGFSKDKELPSLFPGNTNTYASSQFNYVPLQGLELPLDLQLDLNKRARRDTIYVHDTDTVWRTKYVTKKVLTEAAPAAVERDTLFVPIFYIATPLEYEVESTEIRVVDDVSIIELSEINQTDSIEHIN